MPVDGATLGAAMALLRNLNNTAANRAETAAETASDAALAAEQYAAEAATHTFGVSLDENNNLVFTQGTQEVNDNA